MMGWRMTVLRTLLRLVSRRLRDQRGIALITAVLVLAVLSSMGTTVVVYSSSGSRTAERSATSVDAYALAEAGVNMARSTLFNTVNFQDPNAVPQQTVSLNGGTATYSGSLSGTVWTLTGTGSLANPTGPSTNPVTKTVTSQVAIQAAQVSSPNNGAWNYLYAANPTSCTTVSSNITLTVSVYVSGDLCIGSNSRITGSYVGVVGRVTLAANSSVGVSGTPITKADVTNGCKYTTSPVHNPCTSADRVYAQTITASPFSYTKPPVDLAGTYASAYPGPAPGHGCATGSFPGNFDNDTALNKSRANVNLMPSTAYDCRVLDGQGNLLGRISWTSGSPGTLVIAGTIFFDGNISIPSNTHGLYQGRGTIYTSGRIIFASNADLCVTSGCVAAGWNTDTNLLAMVAGESSTANGISFASNAGFQGALYAVNDYSEASNSRIGGPVIARQIALASNSHHSIAINQLLPGMPATYTTTVALVNVDGSFTG